MAVRVSELRGSECCSVIEEIPVASVSQSATSPDAEAGRLPCPVLQQSWAESAAETNVSDETKAVGDRFTSEDRVCNGNARSTGKPLADNVPPTRKVAPEP